MRCVQDCFEQAWQQCLYLINPNSCAQAINRFCHELGITRSDAAIHLHKLDHHVRADLEASSPRALAVLRPLLVTLTNVPADFCEPVKAEVGSPSGRLDILVAWSVSQRVPSARCCQRCMQARPFQVFPNKKADGQTYDMHLTHEIWIEAPDFREQDSKDFYGLAPGKTVMLRYATLRLLDRAAWIENGPLP